VSNFNLQPGQVYANHATTAVVEHVDTEEGYVIVLMSEGDGEANDCYFNLDWFVNYLDTGDFILQTPAATGADDQLVPGAVVEAPPHRLRILSVDGDTVHFTHTNQWNSCVPWTLNRAQYLQFVEVLTAVAEV
jgi:hypothetical protein